MAVCERLGTLGSHALFYVQCVLGDSVKSDLSYSAVLVADQVPWPWSEFRQVPDMVLVLCAIVPDKFTVPAKEFELTTLLVNVSKVMISAIESPETKPTAGALVPKKAVIVPVRRVLFCSSSRTWVVFLSSSVRFHVPATFMVESGGAEFCSQPAVINAIAHPSQNKATNLF